MQTLLIMRGLPGSGKSTFARHLVAQSTPELTWKRINKDELRIMLDNNRWSAENEHNLNQMVAVMVKFYLRGGFSVISDNMNFDPKHIKAAVKLVNLVNEDDKPIKVDIQVVDFATPIDVCIERDRLRSNPVTEQTIRDIHTQWIKDGNFPDIRNILAKVGQNDDRKET